MARAAQDLQDDAEEPRGLRLNTATAMPGYVLFNPLRSPTTYLVDREAGGPGPDRVHWVEAIRARVEEGRAPERLVASKLDMAGNPTLTRPVCPYPQVAEYDGSGDANDEQSFRCVTP